MAARKSNKKTTVRKAPRKGAKKATGVCYVRVRPYNTEAIPKQMARNYVFKGKRYQDEIGWYGPITEAEGVEMAQVVLHPSYASVFEVCDESEMSAVVIAERQAANELHTIGLPVPVTPSGGGTVTTVDLAETSGDEE